MTVSNHYEAKYGLTVKMLVRVLGGDPNAILSAMQDKVDNPTKVDSQLRKMMRLPALDADGAADAAHTQMLAEAERLYFAAIDRASAVAICNALSKVDTATISIHPAVPELTYNARAFMGAWNRIRQNDQPIIYQSDFAI